jgi:hypothetical protein
MTDQLRECPFCNGDGELDIDENHNHFVSCIECRAEGSRAACASDAANAWNTRPTAVASHAEGEVVAWQYRMVLASGRASNWQTASKELFDYYVSHPTFDDTKIETRELFTHPPRSGDEARDAARWRKFLSMVDPDKVPGGFTLYFAIEEGTDQLCYADNDITEIVDAAMAARGGE